MTDIRRLAIVNRGEPAVRALTAVAELNGDGTRPPITTVVLYTDPDAQSWFVREADEAIPLGPATYVDPESGHRRSRYLDEPLVVDLLTRAGVDAVWVGWGFVAEHASFAERCEKAGIVFVGPDSPTIRMLGDKVAAKRVAERAQVPVVPWSGEPLRDAREAAAHAERIGYPVVLKAAAGGGGRGIRVVHGPAGLDAAFAEARAEAQLAFGDATVFLERMVPAARHVEVQVIADGYGTTWAVGVRDCSIQRRHQKVLEESASTALDARTEAAIRDAAVRLMSAAGYRNAGTVEFLVDPDTGEYLFMEVNTRLQVEHPVTEQTTGLDLVKLQLHVAGGGRLTGAPPPVRGHAVEARLCAEDPEQGFVPAPGRLAVLAMPTGTGIRVDTGVREGDVVAAEFDSMIAKIIATGADRAEALTRLRRALVQTTAVVEGGTTNRSFLLTLLDRPEVRAGRFDNHWLDRLTEADGHLPAADPVALLVAATEAYEADTAADRAAFHVHAGRGRPELPAQVGQACVLRYRGVRYQLRVFRTGPDSYRIDAGGTLADVTVDRIDRYRRRVLVGEHRHRVTVATDGAAFRVDVDGAAHTVARDDGGVVRSGWPAFVVSVAVAPGDVVAEGDPLLVVESMKMETAVTAPYGGVVAAVEVVANAQVDAGAPLLRIRADATEQPATGSRAAVDLTGLVAREPAGTPPCERVYGALCGYLLGYDLDPATVRALLTRQRRLGEVSPPADAGLLHCEDGLLDLFADVGSLYRPRTEPAEDDGLDAPQEYLLSYLQWLDPERAGLPDPYRQRLQTTLRRYGVAGLERTPQLEAAVVWMFRSFSRVGELVPVVSAILERRLRHSTELAGALGDPPGLRARLDRLAAAAQGRHPVVADLARDARFRFLDEPLLAGLIDAEYSTVDGRLCRLADEPDGADRAAQVGYLVASPQPLRGMLLRHWLAGTGRRFHEVLLEVYTRRYYRIRELGPLHFHEHDGQLLCSTDYELDDRRIHLVTAFAPLAGLPGVSAAVAAHLTASADPDRDVVVDLLTWRPGDRPDIDMLAEEVHRLLGTGSFGRPLWRLDVTVTSTAGGDPEHLRTQHLTFRQPDGPFVEDPLYRNLHPMLGKRLDLWRLGNFVLERLPSAEDVYLFHGIARDNPADHRLFALAEVRDLTPVADSAGTVSYPRLELIGLRALAAMRRAIAGFPERERPAANRIVLYVRPLWTVPRTAWSTLARSFAPLAAGSALQKLVVRVRIPENGAVRDAVLHVEGLGRQGLTVRERPPAPDPIRPLTPYRQKVLRAQRFGAPYPYEILRMLAPPPGTLGRFPPGGFQEYDLDADGTLVPVDRPAGANTANIVVGVVTNRTAKVPEGVARVVLLGDPTRGLGNLAEGECRRIIAGMLTGKQALDFSGGVSAEDNFGIGGFDRVMGPNGQGQYWAATLPDACEILLRHYEHTYVVPGERYPRRAASTDPVDRDVRDAPHPADGTGLRRVGDVFSAGQNPDRKKPFDIRAVLRSVTDTDAVPLERWAGWRDAETAVVWDAHLGGIPVCLLGLESRTVPRRGFVPADGPSSWTSGTLFPQSSRKVARAINAASGNRPLVVLANLSGFDGSPESMRRWQLEYGAEIGRAVTNFRGPIVFVVVSRYHGGAFVVFSKRLNERMEIAAVEGSYASVIGGAPAAATVFAREVKARTEADPRVRELAEQLRSAAPDRTAALRTRLADATAQVRAEKLGAVADEFDTVHSIQRALAVGSVDRIIPARNLRPYLIDALERGMARDAPPTVPATDPPPPPRP